MTIVQHLDELRTRILRSRAALLVTFTVAMFFYKELIGIATLPHFRARGWLGLPAVAGLALVFAFLRKELAIQLLVALAVIEFGAAAASLDTFLSPAQLFVYAVVSSVSVPCVATLATLAGEFGWRAALAMSGATIGIALAVGGVLARLLGTV